MLFATADDVWCAMHAVAYGATLATGQGGQGLGWRYRNRELLFSATGNTPWNMSCWERSEASPLGNLDAEAADSSF